MPTIEPRTTAKGEKRYRVKVRLLGQAPRTRTFKRLTDAKAWAAAAETDLSRGDHVPTTAQRRTTLADLIDKFVKEQLPLREHATDERNVRRYLDWWKANAGYLTLERLKPAKISELRKELLARRVRRAAAARAGDPAPSITPATANRYLAALSAVCKWAWKELGWLSSNPVLSVSKGPEHAGIVRFLSDEERDALLATCKASADPNIYCAVMLALATGARA